MSRGSLALVLLAACTFRTNRLAGDGSGACTSPPSCDDGIACTADAVDTATCTCTHTAISAMTSGDGCCPAGGTYATDHDCSPTCGNGIVEGDETCDTGIASGSGACPTSCDDGMACTTDALVSGGTCSAACSHTTITQAVHGDGCCPAGATGLTDNDCPAAYRVTALTLMDPHMFVNVAGCNDVTSIANGQEQYQIGHDSDNDGYFDDSLVIVFRPLAQGAGMMTPAALYFGAQCTTNATTCKPGSIASAALTATSAVTGTCLAAVTGTTKPYSPAVTSATGPCFSTAAANLTGTLLGTSVPLQGVQVGATYDGAPATGMMNGLLSAFIAQTDAQSTNITVGILTAPIASFLPGGSGNCASYSDKDTYNATAGWWLYQNFTATAVPWTDP